VQFGEVYYNGFISKWHHSANFIIQQNVRMNWKKLPVAVRLVTFATAAKI